MSWTSTSSDFDPLPGTAGGPNKRHGSANSLHSAGGKDFELVTFGDGALGSGSPRARVAADASNGSGEGGDGGGDEEDTPPVEFTVSFGRLMKLAAPEKWLIVGATVGLIVSSIAVLALPFFGGQIVDTVSNTELEDQKGELRKIVLRLMGTVAVACIFVMMRTFLFRLAADRMLARLRKRVFQAIVEQEIGFFDQTRTGELVNRLASDTGVIQATMATNMSLLLRNIATSTFALLMIFLLSWRLTLVMLAAVPPISIGAVSYGKFVRKLTKQFQDALADSATVAEESISNVRTVRAFAQEDKVTFQYGEKIDHSYQLAKKTAYAFGGWSGGVGLFGNTILILVLWFGANLVIDGDMTTGALTSFLLYSIQVAVGLGVITSLYGDMMKAAGAAQRLFEILDREPEINARGGRMLDNVRGHVELRNVSFAYPTRPESTVLHNININLEPGKVVALVGQSGGGKSSCVSLIERFYDPMDGAITLDGVDIRDLDPMWLRRQIGVVSQEPVLFATSITENIAFGVEGAGRDEIVAAARQANAHEFITAFPEGYDSMVGERGLKLSGGQKQRVAIARALLKNPRVLLLDEATSALDAESEHLVQEALDRLMEGRSTLVVAHRLSTIQTADLIVVIHDGRVVEVGTHSELLARTDGTYRQLVSRQMQDITH